MLFSLFGEIGLFAIGILYVLDMWYDSYINYIINVDKNNDDNELPESVKHMYN